MLLFQLWAGSACKKMVGQKGGAGRSSISSSNSNSRGWAKCARGRRLNRGGCEICVTPYMVAQGIDYSSLYSRRGRCVRA
jgi:hypothetical protein